LKFHQYKFKNKKKRNRKHYAGACKAGEDPAYVPDRNNRWAGHKRHVLDTDIPSRGHTCRSQDLASLSDIGIDQAENYIYIFFKLNKIIILFKLQPLCGIILGQTR
jgi:hypothetical protein